MIRFILNDLCWDSRELSPICPVPVVGDTVWLGGVTFEVIARKFTYPQDEWQPVEIELTIVEVKAQDQ